MKRIILLSIFLLFTSLTLAQPTQSSISAGFVKPDSVLYQFDVFLDDLAISVGLKTVGNVAQERATEAKEMADKKNFYALDRVVQEVDRITEKKRSQDTEAFQEVANVLNAVKKDAPPDTVAGIETTISKLDADNETAPEEQEVIGPPPSPDTIGE